MAIVNTSSISSSSADSSKEALAELVDDDLEKRSSLRKSTEDIFRGQPDGRDEEDAAKSSGSVIFRNPDLEFTEKLKFSEIYR